MTEEVPTYESQTLEDRLKGWEKEKKGLIADLQKERAERHSLEERLTSIEKNLPSTGNNGENPEDRVNALAADPDGYISEIVSEAVEPLKQHISNLVVSQKLDRARKWIAKKEGIDPDEVDDKLGEDLIRIGNERGFITLDPEKGVRAAYDILLQEREEKEREEKERSKAIAGNSTEHVRNPVRAGSARFTREEIARMSSEEFNARFEEIQQAKRNGLIS